MPSAAIEIQVVWSARISRVKVLSGFAAGTAVRVMVSVSVSVSELATDGFAAGFGERPVVDDLLGDGTAAEDLPADGVDAAAVDTVFGEAAAVDVGVGAGLCAESGDGDELEEAGAFDADAR